LRVSITELWDICELGGAMECFILILIGSTSAGAYLIGAKRIGLSVSSFRKSVCRILESVGMTIVFFFINVAVGTLAILSMRIITDDSVSLYLIANNSVTLLVLSFLQGFTFNSWRELSKQ